MESKLVPVIYLKGVPVKILARVVVASVGFLVASCIVNNAAVAGDPEDVQIVSPASNATINLDATLTITVQAKFVNGYAPSRASIYNGTTQVDTTVTWQSITTGGQPGYSATLHTANGSFTNLSLRVTGVKSVVDYSVSPPLQQNTYLTVENTGIKVNPHTPP